MIPVNSAYLRGFNRIVLALAVLAFSMLYSPLAIAQADSKGPIQLLNGHDFLRDQPLAVHSQ